MFFAKLKSQLYGVLALVDRDSVSLIVAYVHIDE
jgi:hypothetical protein